MEFFNELVRSIFLLLNRRNFKKYIGGEFDLAEEELIKIHDFLKQILEESCVEKTESITYAKRLERQIRQRQIPYLRDLSVEEVDFLLANELDIDAILDVIYAKGGLAKGYASIAWNYKKQKYDEKITFWGISGIFIYFLSVIPIVGILKISLGMEFDIIGIKIFPIVSMVIAIFCMPLLFMSNNTEEAKKRIIKRGYERIFSENQDMHSNSA